MKNKKKRWLLVVSLFVLQQIILIFNCALGGFFLSGGIILPLYLILSSFGGNVASFAEGWVLSGYLMVSTVGFIALYVTILIKARPKKNKEENKK